MKTHKSRTGQIRNTRCNPLLRGGKATNAAGYRMRYFIVLCGVFINLLALMALCGVSAAAVMPVFERLAPVTGKIKDPIAVALDGEGKLYVANSSPNQVVVLSQSGRYLSTLRGLNTPNSLAVDAEGRIMVGSKEQGSVSVYGADFTPQFKLGKGDGEFFQPNGICTDSSSQIYVVDRGADLIRKYDSSGLFLGSLGSPGNANGQFHRPVSMAIDEEAGEIIVLDRQLVPGTSREGARVQHFNIAGSFLRSFTRNGNDEGGMVRPEGITVDGVGRIYVTDTYMNAVLVYDKIGTFFGAIYDLGDPLRIPLGAAIIGANRLHVASRMADRIDVYGIDSYLGMEVDPVNMQFIAKEGDVPAPQSITIRNTGNTAINWSASVHDSWLTISDDNAVLAPGQAASINVTCDLNGLAPGEYHGRINISAGPGATESVSVVLTVAAAAKLTVTPTTLSLASEAGTSPPPVSFSVFNAGDTDVHWSAASDQPWLKLHKTGGKLPPFGKKHAHVKVTANGTGLAPGIHTGTISVISNDAVTSPATIQVFLTLTELVASPGGEPAPDPSTEAIWQGTPKRTWQVVSQLTGVSLNGIWGSSPSDIFAVGDNGMILHYDGESWQQEYSGTTENLNGVWGTSASSVYVVGANGLILHYDGRNLTDVSPSFSGFLSDVWCGSGSGECFTVGQDAGILGVAAPESPWNMVYSSNNRSLNAIWGSSASDIYAAGDSGTLLHFDGIRWTPISTGTDKTLQGVWGSASDNVFAVGEEGSILHFNGIAWSMMDAGTTEALRGIWGNAADEVYAVGEGGTVLLLQDGRWHRLATGIAEDLNDAWGGRRKEVYAVGAGGSILYGRASFPWSLLLPVILENEKKMQTSRE